MTSRRTLLMAFKLQFACEKLVGWVNCFLNWKFSVRSEWEMELFFCSSPLHQLPFNRKSPHYAMLMMMSSSVTWEMQKVSPWWRIDRMLTVNGPQRINWGLREGISQVDLFTTDDDGKKMRKLFQLSSTLPIRRDVTSLCRKVINDGRKLPTWVESFFFGSLETKRIPRIFIH